MIRKEIIKLIEKSIKNLQEENELPAFEIQDILVEKPENKDYGDYSINIAMQIAKLSKRNPMEIATLIKSRIGSLKSKVFDEVKIAEPGFINFFLSKEYLQEQIRDILRQGEIYGQLDIGKNKKVQVEFISANPTGPLTVGNARGGVFGDVLANILKWAGFKVEKAYYINDYGMQILTLGHSVLKDEKAEYKGEYIDYLNKKIKEKDPYKTGQKAAKIIIDEMIKKTTERMGIKYDEWFLESELHEKGKVDEIIERLERKDLTYKKDGAVWFKSTALGDARDRVLIKADGWKTYLAGDIAYHKYKFEDKKFDKVIDVWGADHLDDKLSLLAGVDALGHDKDKLMIPLLQFVTIFEKNEKLKMSKRAGIYVTMDELLDKVGKDVVRFFFLTKSANTHLNFDLSLAKERSEKNPVYYVQYAHARICSILNKALKYKPENMDYKLLKHPSELELIKQLIRFPEVIEDTARDYQIQRIPKYAVDLATVFNQFYRDCRVLDEKESLKKARLSLVLVAKQVLKNTLDLMGISAPEKM